MNKKQLIEKLIQDRAITLDDALILLDSPQLISEYPPMQPYWVDGRWPFSNPWHGIIPPSDWPAWRILRS